MTHVGPRVRPGRNRYLWITGVVVLASLTADSPASAQFRPEPTFPSATRLELAGNVEASIPLLPLQQEQEQEQDVNDRMTISGFFLGIVGMLGGAAVGSGIGNARCGKECVSRYAAGGATIVGSIAVPIGVRIGSGGMGNPLLGFAASAGAGGLIWAGMNQIPGRPVALAPFVAAPIQVWAVSKVEMRGRPPGPAATDSVR